MKKFRLTPENKDTVINSAIEFIKVIEVTFPIEIVIKPYRKNRSLEQNEYYWVVLTHISSETGHSKEDLHDMLRNKFLGMQTKSVCNEEIQYLPSTRKLKVGEMADYITQIEAWAALLGIRLPAKGY